MASTASQILIDKFLKDVDEMGKMVWQSPYKNHCDAFNWFTKKPYRGFNRIFLPFGEYITANQINQYNKEHGEDFKFQKGIRWFPVYFFKTDSKPCTKEEVRSLFKEADLSKDGFIGHDGVWSFWVEEGELVKKRNILRYYNVAEIRHFKNGEGGTLPSRIESEEIELSNSIPKDVMDSYLKREGIHVRDTGGVPCYIPALDMIELNPYSKSENAYYSTAFHEMGHSTGHHNRLNRPLKGSAEDYESYAQEECIAELTAYLLCCECGIEEFETSGMSGYNNNIAYVQFWKNKIKDWGSKFMYICSQADEAFSYIMDFE